MSAPAPAPPAAVHTRRQRPVHLVFPHLLDTMRSTLMVVVPAVFVIAFVVQPFRIPSESMERTLLVGDFLLVDKVALAPAGHWGWLLPYHRVGRGDIVVFHFPLNADEHLVKRVAGVPGDEVTLHDGHVRIDDAPLTEPYAVFEPADRDEFRDQFPRYTTSDPSVDPRWRPVMRGLLENGHLRVPPDEYFVLGDNRNHSRDSRYWGFVPRQNIEGTPLLIYFSVREASTTDAQPLPDGRLGTSVADRLVDFARWDRILHVVR